MRPRRGVAPDRRRIVHLRPPAEDRQGEDHELPPVPLRGDDPASGREPHGVPSTVPQIPICGSATCSPMRRLADLKPQRSRNQPQRARKLKSSRKSVEEVPQRALRKWLRVLVLRPSKAFTERPSYLPPGFEACWKVYSYPQGKIAAYRAGCLRYRNGASCGCSCGRLRNATATTCNTTCVHQVPRNVAQRGCVSR